MIKNSLPAIFLLLTFCLEQNTSGQSKGNMPDYITRRFINYCDWVPREEVFIHTDRNEYIAGEDLWYNIYLIDRQSLRPSQSSKIVYFELVNRDNRPVIQKRIFMDKGFGPGQIGLPDTLSSGRYTIRAYTSWMKNFLPFNCFFKDINIYNALVPKVSIDKGRLINYYTDNAESDSGMLKTKPGLILRTINNKPDSLEIYVSSTENYRLENNNIFYIFIQTHGIINHVATEKIANSSIKIIIPKSLLTPGINQITVFDSKGLPVSNKYIYTPLLTKKPILFIHTTDSCGTRSKVSLDFEISGRFSSGSDPSNLSISVTPLPNMNRNIELDDYLLFGTEFGFKPINAIKDRMINEIPIDEMDSLVSGIKSNWINWQIILSPELPVLKYEMETEDHFLRGSLLTNDHQLAYPDEFLLMSAPGKVPVFQYSKTNYEARFSFNLHIDDEQKNLVLQPDDLTKNYRIYLESSFSDHFPMFQNQIDSTVKTVPPYISKWSADYQVGKIFGSSFSGEFIKPLYSKIEPKRFYGKPDLELIMKNFIKLPVMEEVFFELIPHFTLKKTLSSYEVSIVDLSGNRIYDEAPVLMIDGVVVKDPSVIASLDPETVEKIDAVRDIYHIGDYLFYGIVNVITKAADLSSITLPDYAIKLPYRVIDPVRAFVEPDYTLPENKNSRIPDFRNTLYWNPSVKPGKDGKARVEFWTSDIHSDYEINIQGITSEGRPISLRKIIKIK